MLTKHTNPSVRTLILCLIICSSSLANAQKVFQDDFTLTTAVGGPYALKSIFVATRLDSVKLIISKDDYVDNVSYSNALWLDLNSIGNIETYTDQILMTIFEYDYAAYATNAITCGAGISCPLQSVAPVAAQWATFQAQTHLFMRSKLSEIRKALLTSKVQQGVIQIKNSARTSFLIFQYSLEKGRNNDVYYSLIENATMNGATSGSIGMNSFDRLIGETTEQLSTQFFNLIKSVKGTSIYDNESDFYNANVTVLNDMVIEIKKMKGKYFDVGSIPDRFGFIRVASILPIYENRESAVIDYEKVLAQYKPSLSPTLNTILLRRPFINKEWKFVPDNVANPQVGRFYLRNGSFSESISTTVMGAAIDLSNDGNNGSYYKKGKTEIARLETDSIDVQIVDGEIYSVSFWIKDKSNVPTLERFQYFKLRFPIKELSKSMYNFFRRPYLILKQDESLPEFDKNRKYNIHPSDFIFFDHPDALSNRIFTSIDTVYRFRSTNGQVNVTQKLKEKGLLSIIDLDLFGDLVGFLDEGKPNGLLQTEVKFNFYLNRRPISQKYASKSRFYLFNKMEFRGRFSKIDNKDKFLDLLYYTDPSENRIKYVHAFNLYRFQNSIFDLKLELTTMDLGISEWTSYVRLGILRSNLRDTIFGRNGANITQTPNEFKSNSINYSFGSMLRLFRTHDINIDLDLEALVIRPTSDSIFLSKSQYDEFQIENNYYESTKKAALLWHPKVHFTYNFDRARSRRLIIRTEYMFENKKLANQALFLQIGYSADLNRFINLNKPANANF